MSREQANTYKKFRNADDKKGNLGWAARMNRQGMRIAPEAGPALPQEFGFSAKEAALWKLMKMGRSYNDLENSGVLSSDDIRAFLRGLVSADVLDIIDHDACKTLLPLEVNRALGMKKSAKKKTGMKAKVYRPDIGLEKQESDKQEPNQERKKTLGEKRAATVKVEAPVRTMSGGFASPPVTNIDVGLTRDEKKKKKEIEDAFKKMNDQDHYAFMGIPQSADAAAIKSAYVKCARELHPDNLAGSPLQDDDAVAGKSDKLFKRLQEANSILGKEDKRATYDATLAQSGPKTKKGGKIRRPQEARLSFQKAEVFLKKKEFQTAERHYAIAVEMDGEDPSLGLGLAWCIFLNDGEKLATRTAKARKRLRAIFDQEESAEAAYKLGLIAAANDEDKIAGTWWTRCLKLDPRHRDALQQKRVRDRRDRKAKEDEAAQKSVLGRFFKK